MSSINGHHSGEKFHLLSIVWFVLQKPFTSRRSPPEWDRLCSTLFQLNSTDIFWDRRHFSLTRDPIEYIYNRTPVGAIFGHAAETKRLIPEPILAHRLSHVSISCMRYLRSRQDPNTPPTHSHLRTWAVKSKRSPWLWRRRLRITSASQGIEKIEKCSWDKRQLHLAGNGKLPWQACHKRAMGMSIYTPRTLVARSWVSDTPISYSMSGQFLLLESF